MKLLVLFISILAAWPTFASPLPLAGPSVMNQLQSGIVLSQLGFKVQNFPSNWELKKNTDPEAKSIEMGPSEKNSKAMLSFKTETVSVKTDLEKYVRQYLRDYNQYG